VLEALPVAYLTIEMYPCRLLYEERATVAATASAAVAAVAAVHQYEH
jgi:hypothetical protein